MPRLFDPLTVRSIQFKSRVFVSPMCQYSCAIDGLATPWHLVHLGRFALGGAALVFTEATAVSPVGRISPHDLGLWSEAHVQALAPIAAYIDARGAVPGVQLAHSGRKGSTAVPWKGAKAVAPADGGWTPVAPSALAFSPTYPEPAALDASGMAAVVADFVRAAKRAGEAGFRVIELHMAHGYLLHEFLSPLTNRRDDEWGGSFEGRTKLPLEVASAVRAAWPAALPLFVRISATDWVEGGWDLQQSVRLAALLRDRGIDLVDCSSGGLVPNAEIPVGPGYQVPFARAVRKGAPIATGAVGMITDPAQADEIIASGSADAVLLARAMLRDPNWALHAARALGVDVPWPVQFERAKV
ncbi:MAG TPA: NADH:flavin oxidoreductase/NADH oxidase [Polyangiaceae bacterium]|jgi:2,4-dienoyl-CoA reductase-like NADH-dependent reductase (Old Yellow Enzyme family)|nr:NADH:flavin oxidoreductase/NADH oxidase [Polyangiaceae bacterium]